MPLAAHSPAHPPGSASPGLPAPPARPHRPRRLGPALSIVMASFLGCVALAAPAAAAPVGGAPAAPAAAPAGPTDEAATAAARPPAAAGRHCVLAAGSGARERCFADFPSAVAHATGGRVTDAPASPAAAARDASFTAALEAAPVAAAAAVVGIEYANLNYGGSSLTLTAARGCDNSLDVDWRFPSLSASWNDRISSFRSYSNCAQQLFRGGNFSGGALTHIVTSMSYVGAAANDQASSITFN